MNKVLLAVYIDVSGLPREQIEQYMRKVKDALTNKEECKEISYYFIPVRDGNTRIELIYPKYYVVKDEDMYRAIEEKESKFKLFFENMLNKLK